MSWESSFPSSFSDPFWLPPTQLSSSPRKSQKHHFPNRPLINIDSLVPHSQKSPLRVSKCRRSVFVPTCDESRMAPSLPFNVHSSTLQLEPHGKIWIGTRLSSFGGPPSKPFEIVIESIVLPASSLCMDWISPEEKWWLLEIYKHDIYDIKEWIIFWHWHVPSFSSTAVVVNWWGIEAPIPNPQNVLDMRRSGSGKVDICQQ